MDLFSYVALLNAIERLIPAPQFFVNTFAREGDAHSQTSIEVSKISGKVKMAPLAERGSKGNQLGRASMEKNRVEFPHIRLWEQFTCDDIKNMDILQHNMYGDNAGIISRRIAQTLQYLKDSGMFRVEWMYWKMLVSGAFSYTSNDGVSVSVNYKRDSDNSMDALVDWDESTSDPEADFDAIDEKLEAKDGAPADTYIMGEDTWKFYRKHEGIKDALDNRRIEIGKITYETDYLLGYYKNRPIYVYRADDRETSPSKLLPATKLIGFNRSKRDFFHEFGAISDLECPNPATKFFSKSYDEKNPSAKYILLETNPLPLTDNINGIVCMEVKKS